MNVEISPTRKLEEFPNPFAVANLFHYATALVAGIGGMWLGIVATSEGFEANLGASLAQVIAAVVLLLLGLGHGAWAWRHSVFRIDPEKVSELGKTGSRTAVQYVRELMHKGVPQRPPGGHAADNLLFKVVPNLQYAPDFVHVFALLQWRRLLLASTALASFTVSMLLTMDQAIQPWVAATYLAFTFAMLVNPLGALRKLASGRLEALSTEMVSGTGAGLRTIALLVVAPLGFRVASRFVESSVLDLGPMGIYAGVVLGVAVLASFLYFMALVAQTRAYDGTRANGLERKVQHQEAEPHLPFAEIDRHLRETYGEYSSNQLRVRELNRFQSEFKATPGDHEFKGFRVIETQPFANAAKAPSGTMAALAEALGDPKDRYLVAQGVLGLALVAIAVGACFRIDELLLEMPRAGYGSFAIFIAALLSAAEFCFSSAHELWQRFEFKSELVWVDLDCRYRNTTQTLRDLNPSDFGHVRTGSEMQKNVTTLLGGDYRVWVASVQSVSFSIDSYRGALAVHALPANAEAIAVLFEQVFQEQRESRLKVVGAQAVAKQAYSGNVLPQAPQPAGTELIPEPE